MTSLTAREAVTMDTCDCRTMAIGRCRQCQTPVCLHHSRLLDAGCLCLPHYKEAVDEKERAERATAAVAPQAGPEPRQPRRGWGRRR